MRLYKLTDANHTTRGRMSWSAGVTNSVTPRDDPRLCTGDVIHAYTDPDLAQLLNLIHGNHHPPVLWDATGEVVVDDWGKVGVFSLTLGEQRSLPSWFVNHHARRLVGVAFGALCARAGRQTFAAYDPRDLRVASAIRAALNYVDAAYTVDAAGAAYAAANVAYAVRADYAFDAARVAAGVAYAAYAAHRVDTADAAYAAAYAADVAARVARFNPILCARQAVRYVCG